MLKGVSSMRRSAASTRTWPTISPAVRWRVSPIFPVRQNAHCMAQPTCDEMQKVCAGVSGMKTDSMRAPSASSKRYLVVPSMETSLRTSRGVAMRQRSASVARSGRARSVMRSNDGDPALVDPAIDLAGVEALGAEAVRPARPAPAARAQRDRAAGQGWVLIESSRSTSTTCESGKCTTLRGPERAVAGAGAW